MNQQSPENLPHCTLTRRLAAILYDAVLLFGVLGVAATLALAANRGQPVGYNNPVYISYMSLVAFLFYAWFWTHGGQTLVMKTWRIRVQTREGTAISWTQALLRFVVAIVSWLALGLGFLWSLIDKERLTWHDRYSMSVIVQLPPRERK